MSWGGGSGGGGGGDNKYQHSRSGTMFRRQKCSKSQHFSSSRDDYVHVPCASMSCRGGGGLGRTVVVVVDYTTRILVLEYYSTGTSTIVLVVVVVVVFHFHVILYVRMHLDMMGNRSRDAWHGTDHDTLA